MKKKLLVFASTFPRWKNDTNPPFVYELSKRLTKDFDVYVLAPHYPKAKRYEVMDKMKVYRFRYFFEKYEKLAGSGGILPTLKKNKWFYLQVPFFLLGEYFALKKLVKEIKPDMIHAHWIIPQGFIAALVKKSIGVPFVVTSHGGDIFGLQGKIPISMKRFTLKNAKRITVVSNAIKNEVHKKIDSNVKVDVIPMGVDSKLFNPSKKDPSLRKRYGINGPFLLFVGRLAEKKGIKYLIGAMPKVIKKFPNTKLLIVGSGELESELKSLTKELKMEDNIIFIGPIVNKELPKYYATADIFVCPSVVAKNGDREGLPVTLMEAMASGCIVIASDLEGNKDIIKNNLLIKQESSLNISTKIVQFLGNTNLIKKTKSSERNELSKVFDWEVVSRKYHGVLRK